MTAHEGLEIEYIPVVEIVPNPRNPRVHDAAMPGIIASIEQHGFVQPVVCNRRTGRLVIGHGRLKAVIHLGRPTIAVVWIDCSEEEELALMIADNRVAERSEWDEGRLGALLSELRDEDVFTGYTAEDFDALMEGLRDDRSPTSSEEEPPLPEVPEGPTRVQPGEMWALGGHRILVADSTNPDAVQELIGTARSPLLFTSPPYMDVREYAGTSDLSVAALIKFLAIWAPYAMLQAVNLGIIRRENAIIRYWDEYIAAAEGAGLKLLSWNVWDRLQPWSMGQNTAMFPIEHEWVFVFGEHRCDLRLTVPNKDPGSRMGITNRQADGTLERVDPKEVRTHRPLGTIFRHAPHSGRDTGHPARFPVAFPQAYILACSDPGQIILDPFLGSGSTLIAAEQEGRLCYGMGVAPRYCDIAIARWERATGQTAERLT